LLPLAGQGGILGVALSGAGPSVILIIEGEQAVQSASSAIRSEIKHLQNIELRVCGLQALGGKDLFQEFQVRK
jgi:homoserine kinase